MRPERPYVVPRPLEIPEVPEIAGRIRIGAENALEAGFDGVELHRRQWSRLRGYATDTTPRMWIDESLL